LPPFFFFTFCRALPAQTKSPTNDYFLVGADPCVRLRLRAHTRVRPYNYALFDGDLASSAEGQRLVLAVGQGLAGGYQRTPGIGDLDIVSCRAPAAM